VHKYIIALFLLSPISAHAVEINMDVIHFLESSRGINKNISSAGAVGPFQIRQICLTDYNERNTSKYTLNDMLDYDKAYIVAYWALHTRAIQLLKANDFIVDLEGQLLCYFSGIKNVVNRRVGKKGWRYIWDYKKALKK